MKIFDKILSVLGFESDSEKTADKVKPKNKKSIKKASYNLKAAKKIEEMKVADEQDVIKAINALKKSKTIIIDLSVFEKGKKFRAFDFISGAVFALEGLIKKLDENKYICTIDEANFFEDEDE